MKRWKGKTGRRIVSVLMTAVLTIPMLAGPAKGELGSVQAATLSNPRRSGAVVTWDCVYFGRYAQSDAKGTKKDAIKWRVLSVNGNDAFLVADQNLDVAQYHDQWVNISWEKSTIRSWLNGYGYSSNASTVDYRSSNFLNRAFSVTEQAAILTTDVKNANNPEYSTSAGNDTKDKIFLLSYSDVTNSAYGFGTDPSADDPARERVNTAYVAAGGTAGSDKTGAAGTKGWWWLRSPGSFANGAMYVGETGITYVDGIEVNVGYFEVCPALHLDLSKTKVWSFAGTVSSNGTSTAGDNPPTVEDETEKPLTDPETEATYISTTDPETKERTAEFRAPKEGAEEVKIPDTVYLGGIQYTVTSIADNAFLNNKKLKKVTISANVETIGKNAFSGCTNLTTVKMGKNVTTIGERAFYNCKKLKKVTIPASVKKIGKAAFYGCKKLKTITVKTTKLSKKKIGSNAFEGIHAKAVFKVPKSKLSAYQKLFKARGAGSKTKVKK